MPEKLITLNDSDVAVLREVIAAHRRNPGNPPRPRTDLGDDIAAPEVYVARAPGGGVPAADGLAPGSADCDVYRLLGDDPPELEAAGFVRTVYNLASAVDAGAFVLVNRDKYGRWFSDPVSVVGPDDPAAGLTGNYGAAVA
jgi:hypothetical protein